MKPLKLLFQKWIARFYSFFQEQEAYSAYRTCLEKGILEIGRHSYGIPRIDGYKGSQSKVCIGNFCSISKGVVFVTGGIHPVDWVSTFPFRIKLGLPGSYTDGMPATKGDIVVGSDVWIGTDAMIFSGVTIGDGAVIASRSVVTRDIPPYAIAAGAPARMVKMRFEQDVIDQLLEIKWWDWDDEKVQQAVPLLSSQRIDEFLTKYSPKL